MNESERDLAEDTAYGDPLDCLPTDPWEQDATVQQFNAMRDRIRELEEQVELLGGGLENANEEIERLRKHENETRRYIRLACDEIGDLDWDDSLHLGDVVEKHLERPASSRIRELEEKAADTLAMLKRHGRSYRERIRELEQVNERLREEIKIMGRHERVEMKSLRERLDEALVMIIDLMHEVGFIEGEQIADKLVAVTRKLRGGDDG